MHYGEIVPGVVPQTAELPWATYPAEVAWPGAVPTDLWAADWDVPLEAALDAEGYNPVGIVPFRRRVFVRPFRRFAVPVHRFGVPVRRFVAPVRPFAFPFGKAGAFGKPFGKVII